MIKVLQVIEDMGLNSGVSSMLLNYYKYMNHDKVNFDFITFKPVPEDVKEYFNNIPGKGIMGKKCYKRNLKKRN